MHSETVTSLHKTVGDKDKGFVYITTSFYFLKFHLSQHGREVLKVLSKKGNLNVYISMTIGQTPLADEDHVIWSRDVTKWTLR